MVDATNGGTTPVVRRIGTIAIGHVAKKGEEFLFDWVLYSFVVYTCTDIWGPIWGSVYAFVIMAWLSAWVCEWYIKIYDRMKVDWLGFEALKDIREMESGAGWFTGLIARMLRKGKIPAFFALSLYGDPFMVTIYFRDRKRRYNGMGWKDYAVFTPAVIISNAYWTLRWAAVIEIARVIYTRVFA